MFSKSFTSRQSQKPFKIFRHCNSSSIQRTFGSTVNSDQNYIWVTFFKHISCYQDVRRHRSQPTWAQWLQKSHNLIARDRRKHNKNMTNAAVGLESYVYDTLTSTMRHCLNRRERGFYQVLIRIINKHLLIQYPLFTLQEDYPPVIALNKGFRSKSPWVSVPHGKFNLSLYSLIPARVEWSRSQELVTRVSFKPKFCPSKRHDVTLYTTRRGNV